MTGFARPSSGGDRCYDSELRVLAPESRPHPTFPCQISYDTRTVPSGTGPSRWYNAMLGRSNFVDGNAGVPIVQSSTGTATLAPSAPVVTTLRSSDVDEHRSSYCSGSEGFGGGGGAYGGGFPPVRPVAGLEAHRPGDPAGGLMVLTPFSVRGAPELFRPMEWFAQTALRTPSVHLRSQAQSSCPHWTVISWNAAGLTAAAFQEIETYARTAHADIFMLHVGRWKARPPGRASSDDLHSPGQGRAAPVLCSPCR